MVKLPPEHVLSDAEAYDSAEAAVASLATIYGEGRSLLREHFERFVSGAAHLKKADARYPAIWIEVSPGADRLSGGLSYGAVPEAGAYSAVLTNPELFHSYYLEQLLDHDLPLEVPIPAIAEVQLALTAAVSKISKLDGRELKQHLRTGTVVTTDDRDWELRYDELSAFFNQSRAIAVDMESATIAANGFRLRVPYGTLLCVSDKPLHGEIKLSGMANAFYTARVSQHLRICLEAVDTMHEGVSHQALHSRKLRSFDEPPFR